MIDYIIISSDDNPLYKDFYPVVANKWKEFGFKTYYINITDHDEYIENEYGIIKKIKSLDFVSTGFQSQVVRLFSVNFIEGNILTSDIDMMPLNKDYYNQYNNELTEDNVIIYSGTPYGSIPYYPMCYILSHSSNLMKYLGIESMDFSEFCKILYSRYNGDQNTDEHFMYDRFQLFKDKLIIKERDYSRRIDRSGWIYDEELLKNGYYIDSHLPRPYKLHKNLIDKL